MPCNCSSTTIILPVVFQSFTAFANGCNAMLHWVANDNNGDNYIIENSSDGLHFTNVKTVAADGNTGESIYSFTLAQTDATKWYRLKMTGKDGSVTYSRMAAVNIRCKEQASFSAYPNPVADQLTIQYHSYTPQQASIRVNDAAGKLVIKKEMDVQTGDNSWLLDLQALLPGLYYVQLTTATGTVEASQKIMKKN